MENTYRKNMWLYFKERKTTLKMYKQTLKGNMTIK